jgi:hypothetical protein
MKVRKLSQDGWIEIGTFGQVAPMEPHAAPVRHAVNAMVEVKAELGPHRGQRLVHDLGTTVTIEDSHTNFEDCALSAWRQGRAPYHPGT